MANVKVLDCTLRDGGYINDWQFGEYTIKDIISNLMDAGVNIIECGFIRDVGTYDPNSTVFPSMNMVERVINPKHRGIEYAVMIEQHNYKAELVSPRNENTADLIRLTFRRNEWAEAKSAAKELKEKGYKVCIQPVGTASYDDERLISLLKDVNAIKPYAFYLVDTLGIMYRHDMRRMFYLIDHNLSEDIALGFHSHNNLQMSFSNAQEFIRLSHGRELFIDSSCYGMGRGVGNLATELLLDYLNTNIGQKYSLTPVLNIVDKYLMPIYAEQRWGYDLPYFLSAIVKCHPNYAAHLIRKQTLSVERIEKLLNLIPQSQRNEYDADLIEQLYREMQSCDVDDTVSLHKLSGEIGDRNVLLLGSGASLRQHKERIEAAIREKGLFAISVNFESETIKTDASFFSNEKRISARLAGENVQKTFIMTSNLQGHAPKNAFILNYASLLGEGEESDNSGAMLIRAMKKINVSKVYLAGFDGFNVDSSVNYYVNTLTNLMDADTARKKNTDISRQMKLALSGVEYETLTPTKYDI